MKKYTIREAAKITGYSVRTMRQYVTEGKVRAEKQGTKWYIEEEELEGVRRKRAKKQF